MTATKFLTAKCHKSQDKISCTTVCLSSFSSPYHCQSTTPITFSESLRTNVVRLVRLKFRHNIQKTSWPKIKLRLQVSDHLGLERDDWTHFDSLIKSAKTLNVTRTAFTRRKFRSQRFDHNRLHMFHQVMTA